MTDNRCLLLLLLGIIAWQATCAWAVDYVTVVDSGPSSNRVDVAFLGDGYTASQIATDYVSHVQTTLDNIFEGNEDPFPRYTNFFNVYRVNVISNESGADLPPEGIYRDTALDASYYSGGTKELISINKFKANDAITDSGLTAPQFSIEMKLVTVNETVYGGGGGSYAIFAGGNSSSWKISLHELGHSFCGFADEYVYAGYNLNYTGPEPAQANITTSATGEKWSQWTGYVDPDHPAMGAIGAYQGAAGYYRYGLYRPSADSKMRSLDRPFDAVSREQIILDIYDHVDPIDDALDNSTTLVDPDSLWVDVVDPAVIQVEWFVDGELVDGAGGETFDASVLSPGQHEIVARAYDDTDWVRRDLDKLEQSVTWAVDISLENVNWDGDGADGNWDTGANWDSDNEPNAASSVTVDNGDAVLVDSTGETAWQVTLGGSSELTVAQDADLAVGDLVSVDVDSVLTVDGELSLGSLDVTGTLSGNGTVTRIGGGSIVIGPGGIISPGSSGLGGIGLATAGGEQLSAASDLDTNTVPEPGTLLMLVSSLVCLLARRRRAK